MNKTEMEELLSRYPQATHYIQYVRGSRGREGYWRFIPHTNFKPHPNQIEARLQFGETAYNAYGKKGYDGAGLPIVASEIRKQLKGTRIKPPTLQENLSKLATLLEKIGENAAKRLSVYR